MQPTGYNIFIILWLTSLDFKLCKTTQSIGPWCCKALGQHSCRPQSAQSNKTQASRKGCGLEKLEKRLGNVFSSNWWRWLRNRLVCAILWVSVLVLSVRCSANGESCQAAQVVKWKYQDSGYGGLRGYGFRVEGQTSVVFPSDNNFHLRELARSTRELNGSWSDKKHTKSVLLGHLLYHTFWGTQSLDKNGFFKVKNI